MCTCDNPTRWRPRGRQYSCCHEHSCRRYYFQCECPSKPWTLVTLNPSWPFQDVVRWLNQEHSCLQLIRDTTLKLDYLMDVIGLGAFLYTNIFTRGLQFGNLVEPLLQVQMKPQSLPNGVVTLDSNIMDLNLTMFSPFFLHNHAYMHSFINNSFSH